MKIGEEAKLNNIMMSTTGPSFDAKNITARDRTVDYNGQTSDQTAQCIARAHSTVTSNAKGIDMADECRK